MNDEKLKGYDEWKTDYPKHWDNEYFYCDCCEAQADLEAGIEVGCRMLCPRCYDDVMEDIRCGIVKGVSHEA